jgi:hypothetical protein
LTWQEFCEANILEFYSLIKNLELPMESLMKRLVNFNFLLVGATSLHPSSPRPHPSEDVRAHPTFRVKFVGSKVDSKDLILQHFLSVEKMGQEDGEFKVRWGGEREKERGEERGRRRRTRRRRRRGGGGRGREERNGEREGEREGKGEEGRKRRRGWMEGEGRKEKTTHRLGENIGKS